MKNKTSLYSRYFSYIKPITRLPIVKNYSPLVFTLLTTAILIFFAIKPTVETILVLQKKLADSEQVLQKVTQKTNDLTQGRNNYDNLDQSIKEKIAAAIPNTPSLRSTIESLEQTARTHDASVSALQIKPFVIDTKVNEQVGELAEISFIFNMEGDYQKFVALLQDLKTSSRLVSIDNLSLSKVNEGNGLIMSLSGKAYYLK